MTMESAIAHPETHLQPPPFNSRVQRTVGQDKFYIRASPNTGKTKVSSSFMYITASVGEEAHIFIKSNHRRIHSNGRSLSVRYGGHCAGFNEFGQLQIS